MTVTVSVAVSVTVSGSEGRVRGSDRGSDPGARPRHDHTGSVGSRSPVNHRGTEATERARSPATRPRRNHEGTKTRRNHQARPPALSNAKAQRRKDAKTQRGGGSAWALSRIVAAERQAIGSPAAGKKSVELRTRAFVAAALLAGSRARGTAGLPLALPTVSGKDGPISILLIEDENRRGLRSPRARAAGAGLRGERSGSTRSPDTAVSGRPTAGDLARRRMNICVHLCLSV
jgi:hypothetical protein